MTSIVTFALTQATCIVMSSQIRRFSRINQDGYMDKMVQIVIVNFHFYTAFTLTYQETANFACKLRCHPPHCIPHTTEILRRFIVERQNRSLCFVPIWH